MTDPPRGRTCLVTGGAGFIGSHLCRTLVARGHEVYCLDNLVTGTLANVDDLLALPVFHFVERDIRGADLTVFPVDCVYHLAALCGVPRVAHQPVAVLQTILDGARNVLDWSAGRSIRVLYVSSSEIYGTAAVHPQPEDYWGFTNPIGPRSPYVEAKRAGEALGRAYALEAGLPLRIARLFNVYGPAFRADDPRVVPRFVQAALAGEDLTIYGDGAATRSFCYVEDIVDGLVRLMGSDVTEPVNLGFPAEVRIDTLARLVRELAGSASRIVYQPALGEDPPRRLPDIGRARRELDWEPTTSLEDGVRRTIDWCRRSVGESAPRHAASQ